MNFCPRCGTKVVGRYCVVCGALLSDPASVEPVAVARDVTPDSISSSAPTSIEPVGVSSMPVPDPSILPPSPGPATPNGFAGVLPQGHARRMLVWETRFVMLAFLLPVVTSAVLVLAQHLSGVSDITRTQNILKGQPFANMILEIFAYLSVAAVVPLALFLLARTGQSPSVLGLGVPRFKRDVIPGLGIGAAAFGLEVLILIPFVLLLAHHSSLFNSVSVGHEPKYYVIWGLTTSATTAIAEEVIVNGYLITRLGQLGWTPRSSLILSLILRTSYHVYYGLGFILTVPFGYLVTRSFQKHHKLNRPIVAHFLFDAILITIAILK
jgi:membrane protease YdiL (CAAX protease family)